MNASVSGQDRDNRVDHTHMLESCDHRSETVVA